MPFSKHEWHIWKPRPWQPARQVLQMMVRAWFGRNLDHGGAGGGAQDAMGARVGVLALPGLEGAETGRRSSGEEGGEGAGPSTCSISLLSAGDAGEAAFLFFLALVILGEMTGVLLLGSTGAAPVAGTAAAGFCSTLL